MGVYTERKIQLEQKIDILAKRIADDTEKKRKLQEKLKNVSRLALAEEYNCKVHELDEIINHEHTFLQKLRSSGVSDEELLDLVTSKSADSDSDSVPQDSNSENERYNFYENDDDEEDESSEE